MDANEQSMLIARKNIVVKLASFLLALMFFSGCSLKDIPTEFPTPPPVSPAAPVAQIARKPDTELEKQIAKIAELANGKVGVAAVLLETGDAAIVNGDQRFPMQSVYKLPISMAVMDQIRRGELDLDEKIGVTKEDMVGETQHSPLRDANPNGGEFTIRELIRLSIVESDGTASDVLMRIAGGPDVIQSYLIQIGIQDIKVTSTEKEIGMDRETQYRNWATPTAAVDLLTTIQAWTIDDEAERKELVLIRYLQDSRPGEHRLKGLLPKGTTVAHKTGTSNTDNGITAATNDIGIIYLPNGKHVAVAVFVLDSPAAEKTREAVIARVAKAVWDKWGQ